jgi:hypothetical protein
MALRLVVRILDLRLSAMRTEASHVFLLSMLLV